MKFNALVILLLLSSSVFANDYWVSYYSSDFPESESGSTTGFETAPDGSPGLSTNGVTVFCLNMPEGSLFELDGKQYKVVYEKEDAINNAEIACTTNMTDMAYMFQGASNFNQDISGWDVTSVTNMYSMFRSAYELNQDLSDWCVLNRITREPLNFDASAVNWSLPRPNFGYGTCS
jgi:surface protein